VKYLPETHDSQVADADEHVAQLAPQAVQPTPFVAAP